MKKKHKIVYKGEGYRGLSEEERKRRQGIINETWVQAGDAQSPAIFSINTPVSAASAPNYYTPGSTPMATGQAANTKGNQQYGGQRAPGYWHLDSATGGRTDRTPVWQNPDGTSRVQEVIVEMNKQPTTTPIGSGRRISIDK